jgi:predicted Zn-dependent protease with MMP-like domain
LSSNRGDRLAKYRSEQRRYRPSRREFERLVADALDGLPAEFRARLDNIAIVVEEWPEADGASGPDSVDSSMLLGLYQGTPLGERSAGYHLVTPDRITIYRGPILAMCKSRADVLREVRDTVIHEVGHFFGLGDDELR